MQTIIGSNIKDCIIYTDNIEEEALSTVHHICATYPHGENLKVRIMPDVHAGKDIVVGFTCTLSDCINPSHIGVDIGCAMTMLKLSKALPSEKYELFDHRVREAVPTGINIHTKTSVKDVEKKLYAYIAKKYSQARSRMPELIDEIGTVDEKFITKFLKRINMDAKTFYKSLGTLGGGNHFMEYGEDDNGNGYFTIHCGSRNLGVKVCNYWQNKAKGTGGFANVNNYLYDEDMKGYLSDMVITQAYASFNHKVIADAVTEILMKLGIRVKDSVETVHNYIDFSDEVIRKGAVNASLGKELVIPFNMRDGIAVCKGKGNEEWNSSAPHGAGRMMSRAQAKSRLTMDEYKKSMEGVFSTSVCESTIDESPMAYKPMQEIIDLIEPTVEVLYLVKPKINIKDNGEKT